VSWVLIAGAALIFVATMALLVVAIGRRRAAGPRRTRDRSRLWIVGGGLVVPVAVLAALFVYQTRARSERRRGRPPLRRARRQRDRPHVVVGGALPRSGRRPDIAAANEIHLPAGRAALIGLNSGDVIHSFWVPSLAGKVDTVPGRVQQLRLEASAPGIYRGPCAEFCGDQHARMTLHVVVDPPEVFERWLRAQAAAAVAPRSAEAERGRTVFEAQRCAGCHAVRGLFDGGTGGPDLTHVGSRAFLGAGTVPADAAGFARWVADVQHLKPGARMPSYDRLDAGSRQALAVFPGAAEMSAVCFAARGPRPMSAPSGPVAPKPSGSEPDAASEPSTLAPSDGLPDRSKEQAGESAAASTNGLPSALPRPPGELAELERVWVPPRGWRRLTAVNNTHIGLYYIATALLFFVLAGVLALLMRAQLALPDNTLLGPQLYNQVFTMHGTVMMFLFAVPVVEAIAVYLLPGMLGARDLPFPRLSAYAFWAYAVGGLAFFCTIFFGASPDGGWFMYPPLTGTEQSPGLGADWWLLGIGFIEISAIAGAIELIVGILFTRAPGMTLGRMPVFAWAMLVVALMIVFAFPAIIAGTTLLELERSFDWPFFIAARGGDPLLWQHLFWFFGHPEVYIISLPAAGLVSMMIRRSPARRWSATARSLPGWSVSARSASRSGPTTCSPAGLGPFAKTLVSAASLAIAVPTALQVFAWLATLGARPPRDAHREPVRARLPVHLRARRTDRRDGRGAAVRCAGPRHLFHRRPPALRADRRPRVPDVRGALPLDPARQRPRVQRARPAAGSSG
jgi:heme/copper-type cytochrome/quinol oxidase subunit 2